MKAFMNLCPALACLSLAGAVSSSALARADVARALQDTLPWRHGAAHPVLSRLAFMLVPVE